MQHRLVAAVPGVALEDEGEMLGVGAELERAAGAGGKPVPVLPGVAHRDRPGAASGILVRLPGRPGTDRVLGKTAVPPARTRCLYACIGRRLVYGAYFSLRRDASLRKPQHYSAISALDADPETPHCHGNIISAG